MSPGNPESSPPLLSTRKIRQTRFETGKVVLNPNVKDDILGPNPDVDEVNMSDVIHHTNSGANVTYLVDKADTTAQKPN